MCVERCCERVLDLGDLDCGPGVVVLPMLAPATGTYTAYFKFHGTEQVFTTTAEEGDPIVFAVSGLNDVFTYTFSVYGPTDERLTWEVGVTYDCFSIRIGQQE